MAVLERSTDSRGALVIGGDYRALGVVRSLGRHGIPVWVLTDQHSIAGFSRYARRRIPWPLVSDAEQLECLLGLSTRYRLDRWVLIPTSDEAAAFVARHHSLLSRTFGMSSSPWETLRWAYDKRLTYRLADEHAIDHPWTCRPRDREQLAALDCAFPVILKPAHKESVNRFTQEKAWQADDREQLLERYDEACQLVDPDLIIVQELIPGGGETQFSYGALCVDGHPVASVVARRTRQHPPDFGRSSSYVETIEQPELEAISRRLLKSLSLSGPVEVEFKCDPRDNRYKLLDVNARIWGWHTLAGRAGVDLPYLLWRLLQGERFAEVRARPGVRWVRMVTDLPASLREILRGRLPLMNYLRSLRGPLEFAIFALDDPLPALIEIPLLVRVRRIKEQLAANHRTGEGLEVCLRPVASSLAERTGQAESEEKPCRA